MECGFGFLECLFVSVWMTSQRRATVELQVDHTNESKYSSCSLVGWSVVRADDQFQVFQFSHFIIVMCPFRKVLWCIVAYRFGLCQVEEFKTDGDVENSLENESLKSTLFPLEMEFVESRPMTFSF